MAEFAIPETSRSGRCVALMGIPGEDARYKLMAEDGSVVCEGAITNPYAEVTNLMGAATIVFEGVDNIFEVLFL